MSTRSIGPFVPGMPGLFILALLTGCATEAVLGRGPGFTETARGVPGHYAQTTDSATNGCLRNPACYTTSPGEEAVIPWLPRTMDAARTTATMAMMLEDADLKAIGNRLTQCAREADEKVNKEDEELQGQEPTREQCKKVVRREGNKEVTRAMELGARKHKLALDCVRAAFAHSDYVSVEPTYQKDSNTGQWRWIDPAQVEEWLQMGLKSKLWGALVPDVVIHAFRDPNQVQRVYDFKFPCPATNQPSWGQYARDQPHYPKDQKEMYTDALLGGKLEPNAVTPRGVK